MPCYNYGRYLPACVASIVEQPGVSTRVTIVDDASTDDSVEVAERLVEAHPQVKLLRNETNLGAIRTFNRGLRQVDSDYLLLLSADDLLAPGALERASALMEANPTVGLVYGRTQKFTDEPVRRRPSPVVTWTTWRGEDWISMQLRRAWCNIASPEAVVRTSVQHAAGDYDIGLPHTLDVEMWLRIAALADVGHINGVDQAHYRRQAVSMSTKFSIFDDIAERWRAYDQFLSSWALTESANRLRPVVQKRLADEALFDLLDAIEHGSIDEATIESVLELARRIDPSVVERGQWSDQQARRAHRRPPGPAATSRAAVREIAHRTRWHRWHRFRYFG